MEPVGIRPDGPARAIEPDGGRYRSLWDGRDGRLSAGGDRSDTGAAPEPSPLHARLPSRAD